MDDQGQWTDGGTAIPKGVPGEVVAKMRAQFAKATTSQLEVAHDRLRRTIAQSIAENKWAPVHDPQYGTPREQMTFGADLMNEELHRRQGIKGAEVMEQPREDHLGEYHRLLAARKSLEGKGNLTMKDVRTAANKFGVMVETLKAEMSNIGVTVSP